MAPKNAGKSQSDHVKAFNLLVASYRARPSDKLLSELDKMLAVLAKISDTSVFQPGQKEGFSFLLHCQQLLGVLEVRSNTAWSIVSLLSSLASSSTSLAAFLAAKLALLPTLARLLHTGPTASRSAKLLELIQSLAATFTIYRREAFLTTLLEDLASLLLDHSSSLTTPALQTLCYLTRDSYVAAKALLVFLPLEKLATSKFTSPADQVAAEYLTLNLGRPQLSSPSPAWSERTASLLGKMTTLFISAVGSEDPCLATLRMTLAFLRDLGKQQQYRGVLREQEATKQILQLLTVQELADGFNPHSTEVFFLFVTELVRVYQADRVSLFDHVVRVVLRRLEVKPQGGGRPLDRAGPALDLVRSLVEETDLHSLSEPQRGILKFGLEQVLPSLLVLLLDCRPPKDARVTADTLVTVTSCLNLLQSVAGVQEWSAMTAQALQPAKVVTSYRSLLLGLEPSQRSGLTVELLTLASLLQGENKWRKVREELEGEEGTLALVAATLRREGESQELVRKALVILKATDYSIVGEQEQEQEVEAAERQEVVTMGPEQVLRLDQLLESVTEQLATSSLDSVLAGVVELAVARRGHERQEVDSLREALQGAQGQVQGLTAALAGKERQVVQLEGQVVGLVGRLGAVRGELQDIRGQHGVSTREADTTREKLGRELECCREQVVGLEGEREELQGAVKKYKEAVKEEKASIKVLEENQKALTVELKKEMKLKEERDMKLKKAEEKMKKKELQLDDERSARERIDREAEDLKKECAQMKTLTKSQEQALAKKEKMIHENEDEIKDLRKLQETIFNLSKVRSNSAGGL